MNWRLSIMNIDPTYIKYADDLILTFSTKVPIQMFVDYKDPKHPDIYVKLKRYIETYRKKETYRHRSI